MRCRRIVEADIPALADLLAEGFPDRPLSYWTTAFERLGRLVEGAADAGYGYVLEDAGECVGVLLTIFATTRPDGNGLRCNLSSWYVRPHYRSFAALLVGPLLRRENTTLINISPAAHTRPLIEVQGFQRQTAGQFLAIPAVSKAARGTAVREFEAPDARALAAALPEHRLLADHAAFGCICLLAVGPEEVSPFVFVKRRIGRGLIPAAQLIYCRDIEAFVRHAGGLGRHLLARGMGCVPIDANGPVPGLTGRYYDREAPKYVRGPDGLRLGDLAYTELAVFGP